MEINGDSVVDSAIEKEMRIRKAHLKKACEGFESMFARQVLKGMRETVIRAEEPEHATEMYEGMMDDALATAMCEGPGMGLGSSLYRELEPVILADLETKRAASQAASTGAVPGATNDSSVSSNDSINKTSGVVEPAAVEESGK